MSEATTYNIRCPLDLKTMFLQIAKEQDRDGAQLIRDFMRDYVKINAQGDIFGAKPVKAAKRPKG